MAKARPILERFLEKFKVNLKTGCWEWTGATIGSGYGWLFVRKVKGIKESTSAHRFSYEHFVEPIPEGLTIDHICRVVSCVNPAHLRVLTMKDNIMCGFSSPANNARKTLCKRGHKLSGKNLYMTKKGYRQCRICIKFLAHRYYVLHSTPK